ncbi:hypothetical protein NQZ68_033910 [Dissostichus eleginoides]|nr:hypothetical protein NQZ68_033910 [Dissostichus eleginoides]
MHISIQEGRSLPDFQRCATCCEDFHCPFCASNVFHPAKSSKVQTLESHFNRAVLYEGVVNWNVFTEGHKQEFRKAYQISRCFQCDHLYKDVGTGYRGSGRRGMLQGFYSEEGFPGYCSSSCFLVAEGTADPASPQ